MDTRNASGIVVYQPEIAKDVDAVYYGMTREEAEAHLRGWCSHSQPLDLHEIVIAPDLMPPSVDLGVVDLAGELK